MSRIDSSSIKLGNAFILSGEIIESEHIPVLDETDPVEESITQAQKAYQEIIDKATEDAAKIITNAEQNAQVIKKQLISEAEESVKSIQESIFKDSHKEGYDAGYQQLFIDMSAQLRALELLVNACDKVKKEIICSAEREIVELTVAIAEKIIKYKLEIDPRVISNIVRSSINELKDKEEVKIIINPTHVDSLYAFSDELKKSIKGLKSIKFIVDKTLPLDGLLIESPSSRIDAGVDTQIAEISKKLLDEALYHPALADDYKEINIVIQEPN